MKSDNSDIIIHFEKEYQKNANKMPITCQSWHISKSKGFVKNFVHSNVQNYKHVVSSIIKVFKFVYFNCWLLEVKINICRSVL